jgi:hypothetical protein
MAHANARVTVHGRLLIIRRHQAGWKGAHIAAAMGVSRKTVRYWIARFKTEGEAGLQDLSSRPHHSLGRTGQAIEDALIRLRETERAWAATSWRRAPASRRALPAPSCCAGRCRAWPCWMRSPDS